MKKMIFISLTFLLSLTLQAESELKTFIHDVDAGERVTDEVIAYLANGQLLRIDPSRQDLVQEFHRLKNTQHLAQIKLNHQRQIVGLSDLGEKKMPLQQPLENKGVDTFIPTVMPTMAHAQEAFGLMPKNTHPNSQCFNRAQVWTHEWRKNQGYYTSKIWIFFTRRYVRQHPKFIWWFHVAPYVHVKTAEGIKERVMDRKYLGGPRTVRQWTDFFVQDRTHCPVVQNYSEHSLYQDNVSCFIQKSSMYYYEPEDLDTFEKTGIPKTSFATSEIKAAYHDVFNPRPVVREGEVPGETTGTATAATSVTGATTTTSSSTGVAEPPPTDGSIDPTTKPL